MKKILPAILAFILGAVSVLFLSRHDHAETPAHEHAAAEKQLWTCSMHPQVIQDHPGNCPICHMKLVPLRRDGTAGAEPGTVTIAPEVVQNMGVRLSKVEQGPLTRTVRLVGFLSPAQPLVHDVVPRVSGWVRHLRVTTEGQSVAKGEKLFDLYSPELQAAVDEAIVARRAAETAPGNTTAALRDAATRRLVRLGLSEKDAAAFVRLDKAPEEYPVVSPAAGRILGKSIYEGSMVRADSTVFSVADYGTLWLDGQAFEMDLPFIRENDPAEASVAAFAGKSFSGKITFIAPQVDTVTRTATVRMELPNPDGLLKPGMYATLRVRARLAENAVLAPLEAVIDTGERRVAFIARGAGRFEPRRVKVGPTDDEGRVSILSGLTPGEEVVSSGQFLIDSESRMKEAVAKFLSTGKTHPPTVVAPAAGPPLPEGARAAADATLAAYLDVSARLGETEPAGALPVDPAGLARAARSLAESLGADARGPLATRLAEAAEKMRGVSLADQRKAFMAVSAAQIALVKTIPPAAPAGLFLLHCPMAGADWLQKGDTPANPYYARDMKECAEPPVPVHSREGSL